MAVAILHEYPEDYSTGFTQIPNALLRRADVSSHAKCLYAILLSYAWNDESCFPGQETLAVDMGVKPRSIQRYLSELCEKGLIESRRRGFAAGNVYSFPASFPPVLTRMESIGVKSHVSLPTNMTHIEERKTPIPVISDVSLPPNLTPSFTSELAQEEYSGEEDSIKKTQLLTSKPEDEVSQVLRIIERDETPARRASLLGSFAKVPDRDPVAVAYGYMEWQERLIATPGKSKKEQPAKNRIASFATMLCDRRGSGSQYRRVIGEPEKPSPSAPAAQCASNVPFWSTLYGHLSRLSEDTNLPARQMQDFTFETFTVVSYEDNVLIIKPPADLHPHKRKVWPITLQRVAESEMHVDDLTIVWEDEMAS